MPENIERLVYYSRNRIVGSPDQVAQSIRRILDVARRNNPLVGVTGALMFNAGFFAQVLEGPAAAIEHVFERIQQDTRHGDVNLLSLAPAERRAFGQWSMAYVGASTEDAIRYGAIAEATGYDPSWVTGDEVFAILHRLVIREDNIALPLSA